MGKPSSWLRPETRKAIYIRDDHTCQYCLTSEQNLEDTHLTIDHILPQCEGGSNNYTNLITSCDRCNNAKGWYLLRDWLPDKAEQARIRKQAKRRIENIRKKLLADARFEDEFASRVKLYGLKVPDVPF